MMLREELRRRLLAERGIYVKQCCDKCGQLLGPVCYTRRGESGVWCSRKCRGIVEQPTIRKGGRPAKYRTEAARLNAEKAQSVERQRAFRLRVQRNGKPPDKSFVSVELQTRKSPLSRTPLPRPSVAQESPLCENGGAS